ncbi:MAG: putative peptidoglycan glycosyltransferase FtsW [Hespellia sp.]|nr:putative peptidoglycan glycosyltransferase FtsW [Hespellia sp.]
MGVDELADSPKKRAHWDDTLFTVIILLIVIGLVILYSSSAYNGRIKFQDQFYYLKKQGFAALVGILGMYIVAKIDYRVWKPFAVWGYIAAILLSTAVLFIGDEYNGSKRWLSFGPVSFQPSEYAKLAVIVFLAFLICRLAGDEKGQNVNTRKKRFVPGSSGIKLRYLMLALISILPIVALVGSNNLSTAIIILGIAVILVFVATPTYRQFIWMCAAGSGFMTIFLALESYRLERLAIWKNPEKYEKGYQTLQGLYAIGSGGLFGTGLGNSVQKLGFLPEAQNDMIFSIICEELGLIGTTFIIILFLILIWRFYSIASHTKDYFGTLLVAGVMGHMMIQILLNIAVVTNTIPNTGITLPFISYGGTSIVFLLLEMGLVLSVSSLIE